MVQRAHLGNDKTENEVQVENKQDFPFYALLLYVLTFEKCISHKPFSLHRRMSSTHSVATTSGQNR